MATLLGVGAAYEPTYEIGVIAPPERLRPAPWCWV